MTGLKLWLLRNGALTVSLASNFVGNTLGLAFRLQFMGDLYPGLGWQTQMSQTLRLEGIILAFIFLGTIIYQRPIRRLINSLRRGEAVDRDALLKAKRRVLNEPYFAVAVNLAAQGLGLAFWVGKILFWDITLASVAPLFHDYFRASALTVILVFFGVQAGNQYILIPALFPDGRLQEAAGAWRTKVWVRLAMLFTGVCALPLGLIKGLELQFATSTLHPGDLLELLLDCLGVTIPAMLMVGIALTVLAAFSLTKPLNQVTGALKEVAQNRLDVRAPVTSNDEIGYIGEVVNDMAVGLKERELIKDAFGKYVTEEIRDEVLSGRIPLDGEKKDVTVMFADLRNFTPMTEANDPKVVVRVMNRYFEKMTEAIQAEGGLVLQFLGDEIYAVFGAPVDRSDHAARAVRAGLEMMTGLVELNRELAVDGLPLLAHGIGINTGQVVAANIGSPDRLSYLLVGDPVNLAARLQAANKDLGTEMLISNTTYRALSDQDLSLAEWIEMEPIRVKGKSEAIRVHTTG